jgi:hypothetical protein
MRRKIHDEEKVACIYIFIIGPKGKRWTIVTEGYINYTKKKAPHGT